MIGSAGEVGFISRGRLFNSVKAEKNVAKIVARWI
jgi:hypothetical protein